MAPKTRNRPPTGPSSKVAKRKSLQPVVLDNIPRRWAWDGNLKLDPLWMEDRVEWMNTRVGRGYVLIARTPTKEEPEPEEDPRADDESNEIACYPTQIYYALKFPIEETLSRLLNIWKVPVRQLHASFWVYYRRTQEFSKWYGVRYAEKEIFFSTSICLFPGSGYFSLVWRGKRKQYAFLGLPTNYKGWNKPIIRIRGAIVPLGVSIPVRSLGSGKDVGKLKDSEQDAEVTRNLNFIFDSRRDKRLYDLHYDDSVVEYLYIRDPYRIIPAIDDSSSNGNPEAQGSERGGNSEQANSEEEVVSASTSSSKEDTREDSDVVGENVSSYYEDPIAPPNILEDVALPVSQEVLPTEVDIMDDEMLRLNQDYQRKGKGKVTELATPAPTPSRIVAPSLVVTDPENPPTAPTITEQELPNPAQSSEDTRKRAREESDEDLGDTRHVEARLDIPTLSEVSGMPGVTLLSRVEKLRASIYSLAQDAAGVNIEEASKISTAAEVMVSLHAAEAQQEIQDLRDTLEHVRTAHEIQNKTIVDLEQLACRTIECSVALTKEMGEFNSKKEEYQRHTQGMSDLVKTAVKTAQNLEVALNRARKEAQEGVRARQLVAELIKELNTLNSEKEEAEKNNYWQSKRAEYAQSELASSTKKVKGISEILSAEVAEKSMIIAELRLQIQEKENALLYATHVYSKLYNAWGDYEPVPPQFPEPPAFDGPAKFAKVDMPSSNFVGGVVAGGIGVGFPPQSAFGAMQPIYNSSMAVPPPGWPIPPRPRPWFPPHAAFSWAPGAPLAAQQPLFPIQSGKLPLTSTTSPAFPITPPGLPSTSPVSVSQPLFPISSSNGTPASAMSALTTSPDFKNSVDAYSASNNYLTPNIQGGSFVSSHSYASGPNTGGSSSIASPPLVSNQAPATQPAPNEVYLVWDDEAMSMEERRMSLPKYQVHDETSQMNSIDAAIDRRISEGRLAGRMAF